MKNYWVVTAFPYIICGHRYKDSFEEISEQQRDLWLQLRAPLWAIAGEMQVPAAASGVELDGLTGSGLWCGWFEGNMQRALCSLHSATAQLHWHAPSPAHVSEPGYAWRKGCSGSTSLSRRAAARDLPVELRVWEERGLCHCPLTSQPPLFRHRASSLPGSLLSPADHNTPSGSGQCDWGQQTSSTITSGFCFVFHPFSALKSFL